MDLFGLGDGSASTEQAPEQDFFGLAQVKPAGSAAGADEAAPELHRDHGPGTPDAPEPPSMLAGSALVSTAMLLACIIVPTLHTWTRSTAISAVQRNRWNACRACRLL